ncbi:CHAP domain-containing protein [Leucobacter luti]|uniref:CHAP domain-containing protein n=1 Tax=Leucobacter luti TaxID=340320 RepID=UPI001C6925F8|nr:CHAP domain-containing protein [Leucobacter luti]QYM76926.1 CHAP domain-containing protein [Leucobacter luti]
MAKDIEAYIAGVRGQFIDVDGVFGAQCWDQFSHYAMWLGVPAWPTYTSAGGSFPHGGYPCNVHHNAASAGLGEWFEILPASAAPRKGDVAFWDYGSAWYPWSHVATVLEVLPGGRMLRCLTQNPGAVQIADLITNGIVGYLRPRVAIAGTPNAEKTPTLTASEKTEETEMANHYIAKSDAGRQADQCDLQHDVGILPRVRVQGRCVQHERRTNLRRERPDVARFGVALRRCQARCGGAAIGEGVSAIAATLAVAGFALLLLSAVLAIGWSINRRRE